MRPPPRDGPWHGPAPGHWPGAAWRPGRRPFVRAGRGPRCGPGSSPRCSAARPPPAGRSRAGRPALSSARRPARCVRPKRRSQPAVRLSCAPSTRPRASPGHRGGGPPSRQRWRDRRLSGRAVRSRDHTGPRPPGVKVRLSLPDSAWPCAFIRHANGGRELVMEYTDRGKWKALAVLGVAYLMVVLDISIVNVALPSIETDLDFTPANLQWVVSAYSLTFGGLLLLGGRAGDLLGRRRVFMAGLALFSLSSLVCGLSQSDTMLIVARGVQGAAAAILSPSVFSIVMVTFNERAERNKALGILGGIAGSGAAIGVLAGGVLTEYAGWEWIFFVNVPIGIGALFLVPLFVPESRAEDMLRHFDTAGAVTVTASLMLLVYGLTQSTNVGWSSPRTILVLIASPVLMAAFIVIEKRSRSPLVPLSFFKRRTPTGANIVGFGLGTMVF